MTKTKKLKIRLYSLIAVLGVLVIGSAIFGVLQVMKAYDGNTKVVVEGDYIEAADISDDIVQVGDEEIGSLTSPVIQSRYLQINGVRFWYVDQDMIQTSTTTLCRFVNPAAATSTIVSLDFSVTTGTSSIVIYDMATTTAALSYVTTTPVIHDAKTGAYNGGYFATSMYDSLAGPGNSGLLLPTEYVVLAGVTKDYATGVRVKGYCHAVFREL